ncbi:MAG: TIM barrel protein [bacterium]
MDKLLFATAGIPERTKPRTYEKALHDLVEMKLGGMEVEFVRGVNMNPKTQVEVAKLSKELNLTLTAHGPYYINLNSQEEDKVEASITRILDTARVASAFGGYSITFHAAYYMKCDKQKVYDLIRERLTLITDTLKKENINIWVRPELTGKPVQWGDLDELISISKDVDMVLPCIDFSHLHARTAGAYNTYDEFAEILDKIGNGLGDVAINNFHAHVAGIEYSAKGEKRHLLLDESDFNYKDLMKAIKNYGVKGIVICESPNLEGDALLLQHTYESLA